MNYTVYRLENIVTKKNYIGMTGDAPRKRWGYGYTGKMGEAIKQFPLDLCWKKHIEFQTPNKEQALELEAELMKYYDSVDNGYNTSEYANSHFKHSEESKQKMSESVTGEKHPMFGKHHTEETRKKMSEAQTGEKAYWYGKHHSEESKQKMSESKSGENNPMFGMTGEKHPFFGKHHSEETKRKMSESTPSKPVLQYSKDGEFISEYPSIAEGERNTGCRQSSISQCCKGKLKSTGGYIWKYKSNTN